MHRKETVQITFVGMALLAIVITMSSSTPALGVGHWNLDEDFTPSSGLSEDGMDSFDTSDNTGMEVEDLDIVDVTNEDSTTAATTEDSNSEGVSEGFDDNSNSEEVLSDIAYDEFHRCLLDITGEPTEEKVQDCLGSNNVEMNRQRIYSYRKHRRYLWK